MKKITSLFAVVTVIASLSLTACSTQQGTPDQNTETPGATPTEEPATEPTDNQ